MSILNYVLNFFTLLLLDIDECSNGSHDCHQNATCANTAGRFNCSCQLGFAGNGRQCHGIINIARFSIDLKVYVDLHYVLEYIFLPFFLILIKLDIDECSNGSHDCHQDATCINTPGQFNCSCHPGFTGDGHQCYGMTHF